MKQATALIACGLLTIALSIAAPASAITVDGTADGGYGAAVATQGVGTEFGDSNNGLPDFANGSELDEAYGVIMGGTLYLTLSGNLESNFNKVEIFIDSIGGGQNQLRGDNPNVDFDGLNRMGDDGSGNGLIFDTGFDPDYYLTLGGGDVGGGQYKLFVNYAELLTAGGGIGNFVGEGTAVSAGTLSGGTNPDGILATINNSNVGGVSAGNAADNGAGVTTGVEFAIPLNAIGNPIGCVEVSVFINGSGHDFLANQVLGSLTAPQGNLGEPRIVDFNQLAGAQHFTVCEAPVPTETTTWGKIKTQF